MQIQSKIQDNNMQTKKGLNKISYVETDGPLYAGHCSIEPLDFTLIFRK